MDLDKLALHLRAGNAWEAIDLGVAMQRRWWQPLIRVWLAVYMPSVLVVALIVWLTSDHNITFGLLILWWLKPAFERFLLHVLSRAAFGDTPTVRSALRAWREILTPGLLRQLTIARLSPYRSFYAPVLQLERQRGSAARERRSVLGRRASGTAGWNTVVCFIFEFILFISLGMLVYMFMPESAYSVEDTLRDEDASWWVLDWSDYVFSAIAASIIAPLYVASGFALYLHRRTLLEGWDIELGLRRIQARLAERARALVGHGAALLFGLCCVFAASSYSPRAWAADEPRAPKSVINEILAQPEFGEYRDETNWVAKDKPAKALPNADAAALRAWSELLQSIAAIVRALVWVALAAIIIALLWYSRGLFTGLRADNIAPYRAPDQLFGLDVRPDSLPPDIDAAARTLIDAGRIRDALSLLYRGALSALVNRFAIELESGATEGDALNAARRALVSPSGDYFAQLVYAWQAAAYADRLPADDNARALARGWAAHFNAAPAPAPA